ncbi:cytochrome c3 family protein [Carboxydocella sp. JDF658]|uniref:Doubled CXXCH domain-containing protein n=2 Tax=Carboxydocella TaxID=178898 RepID=A0A1T4LMH2_9FIRM|nr:cytochrome c3 family protein [Carboxydocella sp. JDF658]AVX20525.1 doubled CXXCH domain-containing protein [Carboxydocella thermautotrophica]SJZ55851.1 doubled CXXCH domain-containing protein [Carboxydocella sporoproducens DSM 16521]GAW29659.1 hypothetical protein ULO1_22290 [Carboxydocella sp. ULO1]AVX30947.1 doubled CXXCH domain-containing protein [Carboxydocella thermautotrophica]GAW31449.1 hypothetical protein JDF658_12140 [Carboxydocella sp. JDF658]
MKGRWLTQISLIGSLLLFSAQAAYALPTTPPLASTTLSSAASAGGTTITVTSTTNIDVGDVLVLDQGVIGKEERVRVAGIAGTTITIAGASNGYKLQYSHNSGATVVEIDTVGLTNANPNTPATTYEHDPGDPDNFQGVMDPNFNNNLPVTSGPHGRYTTNTNGCGRCHQLHQAKSIRLIRFDTAAAQNPIYGVCTYCHSFNGQSTYDVKDGMIWDTNNGYRYATNGGGFERMLVVEGPAQVATVVKVSAKHRVNEQATINTDGSISYVKFNAPGGYQETNGHVELRCSSCHQPHGTSNSRLLVTRIQTADTSGNPIWRDTSTSGTKVVIKVNNPFSDEKTEYNEEIATFCGACHYDYLSSNASQKSGYYMPNYYRHKMKMGPNSGLNDINTNDGTFGYNSSKLVLPLASIGNDGTSTGAANTVICLTCHYAHGTFVQVTGIKTYDQIQLNSNTNLNTVNGYESPKNLRMDNRGVCQNCHNRTKSTVKPVLVQVLDPAQDGSKEYGQTGSLLPGKAVSPTANTILIRFDQYMWRDKTDPTGVAGSVENTGHYKVTDMTASQNISVTSATLQPDGRTVLLTLGSSLTPGNQIKVELQAIGATNIKDLNFNEVNPADTNNIVTFTK